MQRVRSVQSEKTELLLDGCGMPVDGVTNTEGRSDDDDAAGGLDGDGGDPPRAAGAAAAAPPLAAD